MHGILEILPQFPDLVVSGINFGENIGTGITGSGTIGAALEAAGNGIPALATSLETPIEHHYSLSDDIDFSAAASFIKYFAGILLDGKMPQDVDALKLDVPIQATIETPWELTRISRVRIFEAILPKREFLNQPGKVGYQYRSDMQSLEPGTDAHTLLIKKIVSVTPISLDLTSRVDFPTLEKKLRV
jgi:5'-nucleotidase